MCFEYNDLVERQALRNRLEHLAELYPEEIFERSYISLDKKYWFKFS